MKHAFFETDSFEAKRGPGMITGKEGLKHEIACLLSVADHGVPAVLCDITNVLRHGDVCLLGGSDPFVIEVKSRPGLNQRGQRQMAKLDKLREFLETDGAEEFRGVGYVKRINVSSPERNHVAALNTLIAEAKRKGGAMVEPEPGLRYFALYANSSFRKSFDLNLSEAMPQGWGQKIAFMLSDDKNAGSWAPYTPFTLSILDAEHLHDFIVGKLELTILCDADALCRLAERPGWHATYNGDAAMCIQLRHEAGGPPIGISREFISRIGYEFLSPAWLIEAQRSSLAFFENEIDKLSSNEIAAMSWSPEYEKFFGPTGI